MNALTAPNPIVGEILAAYVYRKKRRNGTVHRLYRILLTHQAEEIFKSLTLAIEQSDLTAEPGEIAFLKRLYAGLVSLRNLPPEQLSRKRVAFTLFRALEADEDYDTAASGYLGHVERRKRQVTAVYLACSGVNTQEALSMLYEEIWQNTDDLWDMTTWIEYILEDLQYCEDSSDKIEFIEQLLSATNEKHSSLVKGESVEARWFVATVARIRGWNTENPYAFADKFLHRLEQQEDEEIRFRVTSAITSALRDIERASGRSERTAFSYMHIPGEGIFNAIDRVFSRIIGF